MLALLSPRLWLALVLAGLLAFTHHKAFNGGKAAVQVLWDKERAEITAAALVASEAARAKEQVLTAANTKVTNDYMLKRNFALLMLSLTLASCANYKPPLVIPAVQKPPPSADLMIPVTESLINVQQLFLTWTNTLKAWHLKQLACKATPATCA